MALAEQYYTFRTTFNPECLASSAALHYVTTLVTHKERTVIVKHLSAQAKELKRKNEAVLSSVESQTQLFQEIETTLEFVASGGSYLPGLDDNLVVDQEVTLPVLHVVQFNANGKIEQIRLHWDQSVLLKGVGVIGARGSNWPITDGTHQAKLIRASARTVGDAVGPLQETTNQMADVTITSRPTKKINPTNDPHTTLDLFAPQTEEEQSTPQKPMAAPRGTLKPQERPWGDLFVGGDSTEATPSGTENVASPAKGSVAPKIGAGKNYGRNRLFETEEEESIEEDSPSKGRAYLKPHTTKYQHFDFYDGHDEPTPAPSQPRPRTKHQSQWDFEDFTTPAKPLRTRNQSQGAHHFSFDDDTKNDSPMKQVQHKPRRDAESHFELQDDGGDPDSTSLRPRGAGSQHHNRNESSLWASQTDDGGPEEEGSRSYTQSTVVSQSGRHKDFDPHFHMVDKEEVGENEEAADKPSRSQGIGANIKDRHKDFDAHWAVDDENAGATDEAHDGSRSRPGLSQNKAKVLQTLAPQWEARDDSPASGSEARTTGGAGGKENRGFRKGTGRQWGFGDGDEGDVPSSRSVDDSKGARRPPGGKTSVAFWEELEGN